MVREAYEKGKEVSDFWIRPKMLATRLAPNQDLTLSIHLLAIVLILLLFSDTSCGCSHPGPFSCSSGYLKGRSAAAVIARFATRTQCRAAGRKGEQPHANACSLCVGEPLHPRFCSARRTRSKDALLCSACFAFISFYNVLLSFLRPLERHCIPFTALHSRRLDLVLRVDPLLHSLTAFISRRLDFVLQRAPFMPISLPTAFSPFNCGHLTPLFASRSTRTLRISRTSPWSRRRTCVSGWTLSSRCATVPSACWLQFRSRPVRMQDSALRLKRKSPMPRPAY